MIHTAATLHWRAPRGMPTATAPCGAAMRRRIKRYTSRVARRQARQECRTLRDALTRRTA